ncbi:heterokaryon incompatibility protein-domain-containing protein [Dichomitus squalens]|uniref:Heterokaryon incompatibility protein-domain-containing protein n=2 Tax=Dichomitus squalens TaxID=114155 RepID=A0A4Q9Q4P1_9APHY|nr:heterokaryon incompatibility protein-domain-containing protein [Dichomitus squalens]
MHGTNRYVLSSQVAAPTHTRRNPLMWLLDTRTAQLHHFNSPEDVPGGYAILSHVWDEKEQSFQNLQRLCQLSAEIGTNPRDSASPKIREFCMLAERHGHAWAWCDTCCIDKTSSSELSEAINSMFRYYALAEVCYAYLGDVPSDCSLSADESPFRRSRWHERGWTLQELIASTRVLFLANDWKPLRSKSELASLLEEITLIPATVLLLEKDLSSFSVAQRMSWAARRVTTRVEDRAYCLLGIFSLNMTTVYGEGENSFRRLQEKIMKRSGDTSLFAWGQSATFLLQSLLPSRLQAKGRQSRLSSVAFEPQSAENQPWHADPIPEAHQHLLAHNPSDFETTSQIHFTSELSTVDGIVAESPDENVVEPTPPQSKTLELLSDFPIFSVNPYGFHAHVPAFELPSGVLVALLLGCYKSSDNDVLGLLLTPVNPADESPQPRYRCGALMYTSEAEDDNPHLDYAGACRTIILHDSIRDLTGRDSPVTVRWRDLRILHETQTRILPSATMSHFSLNEPLFSPIRIPDAGSWGVQLREDCKIPRGWTGTPPLALTFNAGVTVLGTTFPLVVYVGRCTSPEYTAWHQGEAFGPPWVITRLMEGGFAAPIPQHSCPDDHVKQGGDQRAVDITHKMYSDQILLFLHPCPLNPGNTFILGFETKLDSNSSFLRRLVSWR